MPERGRPAGGQNRAGMPAGAPPEDKAGWGCRQAPRRRTKQSGNAGRRPAGGITAKWD
ncbi:hypothetical protein BRYFOR_09445 [Marvinbryantia formatexigens DSM 14469]|uniref:Uncharacterized protein n=1 Tax=Marvinbryantia formatexigens DSM 14469 TaxID=478749 RepID=C6LL98_9FIRM|nr:hypothetical protein BRYFOR_09445 [Marvinbryantia formatexigens DSM 14469]